MTKIIEFKVTRTKIKAHRDENRESIVFSIEEFEKSFEGTNGKL